jgi:hypothetical protein
MSATDQHAAIHPAIEELETILGAGGALKAALGMLQDELGNGETEEGNIERLRGLISNYWSQVDAAAWSLGGLVSDATGRAPVHICHSCHCTGASRMTRLCDGCAGVE